eukprot:9911294-Alexandrium_andersonii.AAC.1
MPSRAAPRLRKGWTACSAPCARPASLPSNFMPARRLAVWLGRGLRTADPPRGSRSALRTRSGIGAAP